MTEVYLGIQSTWCDRVVLHVIDLFQLLNDLPRVLSFQGGHPDHLPLLLVLLQLLPPRLLPRLVRRVHKLPPLGRIR